jgi:hypothetical protein
MVNEDGWSVALVLYSSPILTPACQKNMTSLSLVARLCHYRTAS